MRISSSFAKNQGREQPPEEWINRQLCYQLAEEIYIQIEKGNFKIEDRKTEQVLSLKIEQ